MKLWLTFDLNSLTCSELNVTIVCDLNLGNCLLSLMSHGATYPCCWCAAKKDSLAEKGPTRTFESLMDNYRKFHADGKNLKKAKLFHCVIYPSIIKPNNSAKQILMMIPPPELHLLTGPLATIFEAIYMFGLKLMLATKMQYSEKSTTRRKLQGKHVHATSQQNWFPCIHMLFPAFLFSTFFLPISYFWRTVILTLRILSGHQVKELAFNSLLFLTNSCRYGPSWGAQSEEHNSFAFRQMAGTAQLRAHKQRSPTSAQNDKIDRQMDPQSDSQPLTFKFFKHNCDGLMLTQIRICEGPRLVGSHI